MQPHQERVVVERAELSEKTEKLWQFISGNQIFFTLPSDEQSRLGRQHTHMKAYLAVLDERIAAF